MGVEQSRAIMDNDYEFIYMVSMYETKRHRISHTDMYFKEAKDTHWLWIGDESGSGKVICSSGYGLVHYIRVKKDSVEYKSAIENSKSSEAEKSFKNEQIEATKKNHKEMLRGLYQFYYNNQYDEERYPTFMNCDEFNEFL